MKDYKSKILYQELSESLKAIDEDLRILFRYDIGYRHWNAVPEDFAKTRIRTQFIPDFIGAKEWKYHSEKIYKKLLERDIVRGKQVELIGTINKNTAEENYPI